jgi:hypothetical protein
MVMTLASCSDSNLTKRARHGEIGTYCSDYASTPDLVDETKPNPTGRARTAMSARFGFAFQIERPRFAEAPSVLRAIL